jgi:hypothetical protein
MSEKKEKRGRPETTFKITAERWLHGSARSEFTPQMRSVWTDVLAFAALNSGIVEIPIKAGQRGRPEPDFTLFAHQTNTPLDLVKASFDYFVKSRRMVFEYVQNEFKYFYIPVKWETYQSDYLWPLPEKLPEKVRRRIEKLRIVHAPLIGEERRVKERKEEERTENGLPPVPKNAPFKMLEELKAKRHIIRDLERLLNDEKEIKKRVEAGRHANVEEAKKEIAADIETRKKRYRELVEDYRD